MKPIGVFDSGYGGLTVFKEIVKMLPEYDFIYLGDNARTPYGTRDFETVYKYTSQCVKWLFSQNCPLVILACNTASAKALRTIQQNDLKHYPGKRVLGVIRPTAEIIGQFSDSKHIGLFATPGTVQSDSYKIEIEKFSNNVLLSQEACNMWVPLVESGEYLNEGTDYFIKKNAESLMQKDLKIDTVLLACTHYPLLEDKIRKYLPEYVKIVSQGEIVAKSLVNYLERHPEIEHECTKTGKVNFFTTGNVQDFDNHASTFFGKPVASQKVILNE